MWLLKLHLAISVLCLLTFKGWGKVCKESIKNNGYENNSKKARLLDHWIFFIPILNILCVIVLFVMIGTKKKDLDAWCEEHKNKEDE